MRRLVAGIGVITVALAVAGAAGAGWYSHTYGVDVTADSSVLPTRLHTCDRDFDQAGTPLTARQAEANTPGANEIGTWAPSFRTAVPILGRNNLNACGMVIYLERSPDELIPYDLVGGP